MRYDMRYVIRTAISHGHIKEQITTVGSQRCIINQDPTPEEPIFSHLDSDS